MCELGVARMEDGTYTVRENDVRREDGSGEFLAIQTMACRYSGNDVRNDEVKEC